MSSMREIKALLEEIRSRAGKGTVRDALTGRAEHLRRPLQGWQGLDLSKEMELLSQLREGSVEHNCSAVFTALLKRNDFLEGPPINNYSDL